MAHYPQTAAALVPAFNRGNKVRPYAALRALIRRVKTIKACYAMLPQPAFQKHALVKLSGASGIRGHGRPPGQLCFKFKRK
jgi:hypothetical protein